MSRVKSLIRNLWHKQRVDAELDDEVRSYVELVTDERIAAGMSRDEARRTALAELGGIEQIKEAVRENRAGAAIELIWRDLRHGMRLLLKSPGFALVATGSLALGIGANTAIFSMTKAALLDPIAVSHPEELRLLQWHSEGNDQPMDSSYGRTPSKSGGFNDTAFSYAAYQAIRQNDTVFSDIIAFFHSGHVEMAVDGEAETGTVEFVSGNFFTVLGVQAAAGRTLLPSDDTAIGKNPVVLISDSLWESLFGRSQTAIGKTIEVSRVPLTIVGVVPASFLGDQINANPQIYLPLTMQPVVSPSTRDEVRGNRFEDPETWWLRIMGRVKPKVTDAQAQAALGVIFQRTARSTLKHHSRRSIESMRLEVRPGNRGDSERGDRFTSTIYVLTILAALVLLLACANLANLLLARAAARQREMSVRRALGAGRLRLMQQALTESMLLALLGGAAGTALGYAGRNLLPTLLAEPKAHFDGAVLCFASVLSLLTGLLFGGIPAWQATRTNMQAVLKNSGHITIRRSHALLGKSLVVVQVSLSVVLLVGTGLFVQTLRNLMHAQLGFEPHHLLLFDLALPETRYKNPVDRAAVYTQVEDQLSSLPGVISASASADSLIGGGSSTTNFDPDGEPPGKETAWENVVGEHFFRTMGIPILAGRTFGNQDTETSENVAVINRELARQFFPDKDPIGRTFNTSHIRIIGICGNTKVSGLRQEPPPTFFVLTRQSADWGLMTFAVKTAQQPSSMALSLRDAVRSVDPQLPIMNLRTQEEQIDGSVRRERLVASLTSGFGALALLLACIGIYGITSYTVSRRTNEIGVRMVLGAQTGQVLRMILGEASRLTIIGVIAGLGATVAAGRLIASMLYGLSFYDPATLIGATVLLVLVALAASWIPAHRAASVDPMQALRLE